MRSPHLLSVLVDPNGNFGRGLLAGAQAYAFENPGVVILCEDSIQPVDSPDSLRRAGHIVQIATAAVLEQAKACALPLVNVSNMMDLPEWPRVINDDRMIGRMAAEYFLDKQHRHFAWSGNSRMNLSRERRLGFETRIREAGFQLLRDQDTEVTRKDSAYQKWLHTLPRPCAIFAFSDYRARTLAQAAFQAGIECPDDVSLLGVDNDDQMVWQIPGGLSSVRPDARRIGYLAAKTLHELIQGSAVPSLQKVAPLGVLERNSSNLIAVEDPSLRKALSFIHHHAMEGIGVNEVAVAAGLSRRQLEQKFFTILQRKVYGEILRRRLDHAEMLLRESELPVEEIARRIGYPEVRQLSTAFRKAKGISPRDFRKRIRLSTV